METLAIMLLAIAGVCLLVAVAVWIVEEYLDWMRRHDDA